MRFLLMFPMRAVKHHERWLDGADLGDVARAVEEAGFDAVAMTEHPYPDGRWLAEGGHHSYDPFVSLSYMAAATTRLRLVTYVLVAAYRNPYLSAKAIASLDSVSRGRLTVGMAAGYLRSEFDVLGADFANRGAILDETIEAMRAAWAGRDHVGARFPASGHSMVPAPVQPDGPPLWIGGNSRPARRRAVRVGAGWMPIAQGPEMAAITGTPPLQTVEQLAEQVGEMQQVRRAAGAAPLDVSFVPFEKQSRHAGGAAEFAEEMRGLLGTYAEAGVTWMTIEPTSRSFADFREDLAALSRGLLAPAR
ncbi:TIGR03619 family F420-dependent LLM class oxidoreductase [Pseudonocardia sp. KRD291]|uniref:TIGR03619 family F420-dependent LLM class oxidoreductase n=1 Tax=Pseudonocardia sp. KRD291 TaxID=2792007 RepID=UPI001C4A079F|nr:TIGR03619 family F420-dependent LLM class oxidoreductase [Pseudonocardia sp. KRD291]MBW0103985.1 TIGR03619 family F420-dependent LLM class oxidoreductase [Pseudonocardia sp. KRD291]MDN5913941.1 TIGR03619 family F420-dependent LLM class oxidoreductase [Pseudonocardia sp.]